MSNSAIEAAIQVLDRNVTWIASVTSLMHAQRQNRWHATMESIEAMHRELTKTRDLLQAQIGTEAPDGKVDTPPHPSESSDTEGG